MTTRILVLPFWTRRTGSDQGAVARGVARVMAAALRSVGADSAHRPWLTERNAEPAFVVPESALPASVVLGEARNDVADWAITGHVSAQPDGIVISAELWETASGQSIQIERRGPPPLAHQLRALAQDVGEAVGLDGSMAESVPETDAELEAAFASGDESDLVRARGREVAVGARIVET